MAVWRFFVILQVPACPVAGGAIFVRFLKSYDAMKVVNLGAQPSVINNSMAELRDVRVQGRRSVFR